MTSVADHAPPLSIRGTLSALRWPTAQDLLLAAKATIAVTLALLIGFSQNLENPYWSALTVYVLLSQPQTGAIRAKALFRFLGTLLGGIGGIVLAGLFGSDVGALLTATILAILVAFYAKTLDRTPASYTWFATALTLAVIDIAQVETPGQIFDVATTRMVEICLGILMIALVDSVILPRAATPAFFAAMSNWRTQAGDWAAGTGEGQDLRKIATFPVALEALCVQLPYDIVAAPPRRRDLRFVRAMVTRLVLELARLETARNDPSAEPLPADLRGWILERPAFADPAILDHVERGRLLRDRLAPSLAGLVESWFRLEQALHAIATGARLPAELRAEARRVRPMRSADYLLGLLDVAPLALGLGFGAVFWYLTAWTSGTSAMLFVFISLGFIIGTPGALRSADGIVAWIALTCAISFFYQFGVLPGVTAFPVLIAVLTLGIFPLSLLMTMSPAGILILANFFAFLGLQDTFAGDFDSTVQNACGSLVGCVFAVGALYLCQFDRARFAARRLAAAVQRDLVRVGRGGAVSRPGRLLALTVDRISLFYGIVGSLPEEDPLRRVDLFEKLRMIAAHVEA